MNPQALTRPRDWGNLRGLTSLHVAAGLGGSLAALRVLSSGADPNARGRYGYTPLHEAVRSNRNPDVVLALVAAGGDIHAREQAAQLTPLHLAAAFNGSPAVVALLAAGAALEVPAEERSYRRFVPLHQAVRYNGNPEVVVALLGAGADVNALDNFGVTPLHLAVETPGERADLRVVEALLAAGADVHAEDEGLRTPLELATWTGNADAARLLREAGATLEDRSSGR